MKIRAKTIDGQEVIIVGFVTKYTSSTYAVVVDDKGCLLEFSIALLTVIDTLDKERET